MSDECSRLYEQLVLLFHGHGCDECKEADGVLQYSAVPTCHSVDGVLSHMKYCQAGMSCRFPGCSFARIIVSHSKTCGKEKCPVILNLSEDRKQKVQAQLQEVMTSWETPCKILSKQLLLLFRDHQCDMCVAKPYKAAVPSCHSVDAELSHMKYCTSGMSCRFPGCPDARSIISHWMHCKREHCLVEQSLRRDRKQNEHPPKKKRRLDLVLPYRISFSSELAKHHRQALFVIFHVSNCIFRHMTMETYECDLPQCRKMRAVLLHMETCADGSHCQFPKCRSTSFIFIHYMSCLRHNCEACWPVRSEISRLCGMGELPTARPPRRIWEDLPSADAPNPDNERALWFSSRIYRWIRAKDKPLIGPHLFQIQEWP